MENASAATYYQEQQIINLSIHFQRWWIKLLILYLLYITYYSFTSNFLMNYNWTKRLLTLLTDSVTGCLCDKVPSYKVPTIKEMWKWIFIILMKGATMKLLSQKSGIWLGRALPRQICFRIENLNQEELLSQSTLRRSWWKFKENEHLFMT